VLSTAWFKSVNTFSSVPGCEKSRIARDDARDAVDALKGLLNRARRFSDEKFNIALAAGLLDFRHKRGGRVAVLDSAAEPFVLEQQLVELGE
jgi:hypothetical protein